MIEPKLEVHDGVITATLLENKGVDASFASQPVIPLPAEQEVDAVAATKRVRPVLAIQYICAIAAEDRVRAVSTIYCRIAPPGDIDERVVVISEVDYRIVLVARDGEIDRRRAEAAVSVKDGICEAVGCGRAPEQVKASASAV